MADSADTAAAVAPFQTDDCWNRIGVRGDGSCPELKQYVHCRNCPVYASVAAGLLASIPSTRYLAEWTDHVAQPKPTSVDEHAPAQSVLIFRVGAEWLALPTSVIEEIADLRPVHTVPHRGAGGVVLGLASVRGELVVCASLTVVLGLETPASASGATRRTVYRRLLVIRRDDVRAACPVDEVDGVHRFATGALKPIPDTLARAATRYSKSLLPWNQHSVAVLDDELLFYTLKRRLT